MKKPELVLASGSPRRRLLLRQIGLRFRTRPSAVPERLSRYESPARNVRRIALEKAGEIATSNPSAIVIGADTVVVVDGKILGKPRNKGDARRMLKRLSGRAHSVFTGFALVHGRTGSVSTDVVRTKVWFRSLPDAEINAYVASGSPMDKAGAYGIQDYHGAVFVEKVDGCFYNVMGFPLSRFYERLSEFLERLERNERKNGQNSH